MSKFYEGIAEIFEVEPEEITPEFKLQDAEVAWDSLAIVSLIALADECFGAMLDGTELVECETVGDIEKLIQQNG